jgi:PBP1b-binding outer membrane lipoprotein LpoB
MKKLVYFLFLALLLASCNNTPQLPTDTSQPTSSQPSTNTPPNNEQLTTDNENPSDTLQPPTITYLKDKPTPRKIQIPTKPGTFYTIETKSGTKKIDLIPTQLSTNSPQPQAHFTTYTTDNGLALDAIACSYLDKMGNLWFGTLEGV